MSFRDEREAQRARIDALERKLAEAQAERDRLAAERDRLAAGSGAGPRVASEYKAGDKVYVQWKNSWWKATVLQVSAPQQWLIHYDGWSNSWDEVVGPARIAPRSARPPGHIAGSTSSGIKAVLVLVSAFALLLSVVLVLAVYRTKPRYGHPPEPIRATRTSPPPGQSLPDNAPLAPETPVWVEWRGTWFRARVLSVLPDGRHRVHYEGYSESFDEDVPRHRIRLL